MSRFPDMTLHDEEIYWLVTFNTENNKSKYEEVGFDQHDLTEDNPEAPQTKHFTSWHNSGGVIMWRYCKTEDEATTMVQALEVLNTDIKTSYE